ncbi:MAG: hypothetical protein B5M54_00115 [Candidatus Aminicenantes bacterium 4484_214]|nr:MAG: hypothetical protein B5M54_00115 [Candidatus Aminicenantes bacterium 4484_214]RLE11025.1 MAG: hypothetical protein DRJ06_00030 [Candidatus Aminicenantes bacterium]HDJ22878.1 hypothetical protein [Candidatus Aminicenantes bacterium]
MTEDSKYKLIEKSCLYFLTPGPHNTLMTLEKAAQRADELEIADILVSSTSGRTALEAVEYFKGKNLVIVTHSTGFTGPDYQEFSGKIRKELVNKGIKVLTCQHALGGVGRAVRKKLGTYQLEEIIAYTLRLFGEGTKVAIEMAMMAADAGLVSSQKPCLSIGGTGRGVDTALVLIPAPAQNFFDIRILEIVAKPHFWPK